MGVGGLELVGSCAKGGGGGSVGVMGGVVLIGNKDTGAEG